MRTSHASVAFVTLAFTALPALAQGSKAVSAAPPASSSTAPQPVVTQPVVPPPVAPIAPPPSGSGLPPPRWVLRPAYAEPPPPQKHWYGWQTLIGLSISHAMAGVGTAMLAENAPDFGIALIVIGSTGHVFTGPIVHWAHGHVTRGFTSLGLTLGVPSSIIGIVIATGYTAEPNCHGDFCGLGTVVTGFASGWVATLLAPAVDVAVLSYDELSPADNNTPGAAAGFRPVITGVVPLLGQGKTGLALAGQF